MQLSNPMSNILLDLLIILGLCPTYYFFLQFLKYRLVDLLGLLSPVIGYCTLTLVNHVDANNI